MSKSTFITKKFIIMELINYFLMFSCLLYPEFFNESTSTRIKMVFKVRIVEKNKSAQVYQVHSVNYT